MIKSRTYSYSSFLLLVAALCGTNIDAQPVKQPVPGGRAASNRKIDSLLITPVQNIDVGYMKLAPASVTGSISTLVNDNNTRSLASISTNILLQSQLPGVKSVNTSYTGAYATIRGNSTLNGSSTPLYIVDGIPVLVSRFRKPLAQNVDNDPISDINPEDIESITVLKDAQATAIYGIRGANGVILINTIGGTAGKTYLDFSAYSGTLNQVDELPVLSSEQYRNYVLAKERASGVSEAGIAAGIGKYLPGSTPAAQTERYNNNTNWQDLVLQRGMTSNYHLALRGGDAVAKYSLSLGYAKLKGVLTNTDYSRINIRFNLDYKVGKKLSFLNSIVYAKANSKLADAGNVINTNPLLLTTVKAPTLAVYQQDAKGLNSVYLDSSDYNGHSNPYAVGSRMVNKNVTNHISAKVQGQYTFSPDLVLKAGMYLDYFRLYEDRFQPSTGFAPSGYLIRYSAVQSNFQLMFLNENTLTYTKTSKSGAHHFTGVAGTALQKTNSESKYGRGFNPLSDIQTNINTNNPLYLDSIGSTSPVWSLASFFASANYSYKNKYIFGATLRADGSSRFDEMKWGYFPAISAAWRLKNEDFLKNNKTISDLKLRVSYGITGNEYVGANNAYNALVSTPYIYSAISIGILGNSKFQWENTKQFNAGLDVELLKGRGVLNLDVYHKKTDKLYNIINLPTTSGFRDYAVSNGGVTNSGIETALSWKFFNNPKGFSWQSRINLTYNKNNITALPARLDSAISYGDYTMALQTGVSIGSFFGYQAMGVYQNSADVKLKNGAANTNPFKGGDVIFEDINNDGIIDFHDKKVIGNVNPDIFGGFLNTFSYKNLDLSVFVDFASGGDIYNGRRAILESMSNYYNQSTSVLGAWRNEGDKTNMPRYLNGDPVGNARFSSRWIEDGSYLRLKALTLGYNLPLTTTFKKVFASARVSLTARNLVTLSDYSGYSPEVGNFSNPVMYGADYGNVPPLKSFVFGIQLGL